MSQLFKNVKEQAFFKSKTAILISLTSIDLKHLRSVNQEEGQR